MPKIILITDEKGTKQTLEVSPEKSLLESILEAGFYIKSSCGGVASCSDCKVKIAAGEDYLNPPSFEELKLLGNTFHITKERLSCQLKASGPVTVDIGHHDAARDEKRLKAKKTGFIGKKKHKIRKKEEVESINRERKEEREEHKRQSESWREHWKKKPDQTSKSTPPKKIGGNRRPRLFKSD